VWRVIYLVMRSGKTSWTFPHDIADWEGLGAKITPQALRQMDGVSVVSESFALLMLSQAG
jgi:hypothetical protein